MIYYGTVTRIKNNMLYVTIPEVGGAVEMGPYVAVAGTYAPGTRVAIERVGHTKEDLLVLGPTGTTETSITVAHTAPANPTLNQLWLEI